MTELFPRVSATARGYDIEQVDTFFERARRDYEGSVTGDASEQADGPDEPDTTPAEEPLDASAVRVAAFDLVRHGYAPAAVDAALDRLEAAFVAADRADFIAENGQSSWMSGVVERATTLYERLTRPPRERFAPPERGRGYDSAQVDALLDRLVAYFDEGTAIKAAQVRSTTFASAPRSRAYAEGPVDAYLDRVVDVLLAVE
ncbi:cell division protein DivIVA [Serinibacter arcticus]|uniref:Cell division protein DivIVA n=1 Tax=Serinibacter arcticus TaxID=1655435 RepID=A0A2U1ZSW7_9MICO|nr:DivIVA domain-containing protein [Serinibacter arcticus]PWD50079.1 cell division protein DivIVA [Serinibacter arcticus]